MRVKIYIFLFLGIVQFALCGCRDMLNADSDLKLESQNNYKTINEVYTSFMGIYSGLQKTADQTILLSELRGDLLQPTSNAPEFLWGMYRYEPQADNDLMASPRPYYDIVINCNDFISNLFVFQKHNQGNIPDAVVNGMISATINAKVWATFMVAKFFGEAYFYSSTMTGETDESSLVKYSLDELPGVLLNYMHTGEGGIDAYQPLDWKLILSPQTDAPEWSVTHFRPEVLSGELLLWDGQYAQAVDVLMRFVSTTLSEKYYKINSDWSGKKWSSLFIDNYSNLLSEIVTGVPFNHLAGQQNKLQYYFSSVSPNVYYLKPTALVENMFGLQRCVDGNIGDRTRSESTIGEENGVAVVKKYHLNPDKDMFARDANVNLYRAADLHLMMAEAYCFMGEYEAALAFVNSGIATSHYNSATNTFRAPFEGVNLSMCDNTEGIRGRVGLAEISLDDLRSDHPNDATLKERVAKVIADEVALELAYEGKRWFTLMRMAINLDNPSFLATPVAKKFANDASQWETFLTKRENWFVK